jgi:hypothetical protein
MQELRDGVGNLRVASAGSSGLKSAGKREELRRQDSESGGEDVFLDAES